MANRILDRIATPADLSGLTTSQLAILAREIRMQMIETVSKTGGHIAPNLGVVELTLGIYRALTTPQDTVVFDVGHQCYIHKMITGRLEQFDTIRTPGGISGFPSRAESSYDLFGTGHASDSISVGLGYALGKKANGQPGTVVSIIGDGSMTGGMAYEALNHLGHLHTPMIVILNDNEMSISKNVGALASSLGRLRLDKRYTSPRDSVQARLEGSKFGSFLVEAGKRAKDSVKTLVVPGMFFEELGLSYIGPIDGHDIAQVERAVRSAKESGEPVIIHCVTEKGRGYGPALKNPTAFHGIAPFDVTTGEVAKTEGAPPNYTNVFADALVKEASVNQRIHALTAAMAPGTGLCAFSSQFPDRFWDVGIAEQHAVGLASGLAMGGAIPVVAIYSTFLQRAYDQIIGDVALQGQHVVFALDRAGFVGDDGPTHHGLFDLSYLRSIPTMQILAPSNENELTDALHTAIELEGPVALRYPRGAARGVEISDEPTSWEYGKAAVLSSDVEAQVAFVAVGRMVQQAELAAIILREQGVGCSVVDARWVKPIDGQLLNQLSETHSLIVTVEENTIRGGFGAAVLEHFAESGITIAVETCAVADAFTTHSTMDGLISMAGLDAPSLAKRSIARLRQI